MTISVNTTDNAQTLVDTIVGDGITISDVTYTGSSTSSGTFSNGDSSGIDIDEGIILTSGDASDAPGPNDSSSTGTELGLAGDPDLDSLSAQDTNDASILEFDFETDTGDLFFNFVFGSEEYNEFVNSDFDDVFGFFLDGENIAFIPGTNTPVTIDNINLGSNSEFFNDNEDGTFNIEYDGFTDVFTVEITGLEPGTHNIKLAVGDAGDSSYDSAVFIEGDTFSSTPTIPNPVFNSLNPVDSGTEGNDGIVGTDDADLIEGLGGNDAIEGKAGDDEIDGGDGTDTAVYQFDTAGVTVDLSSETATDGYGDTDTLISIENIIGSDSDDFLTGDDGNNNFTGRDGDDTISGQGGNDFLFGGAGSDNLSGGGGSDTFLYQSPDEGGDSINDFEAGTDKIMIVGAVFPGDLSGGVPSENIFFEGSAAVDGNDFLGYDAGTGEVLFDEDGAGGADPEVLATLPFGTEFTNADILVI